MKIKRLAAAWSPTSWVTLQTSFVQAFGFLLFAIQAPLLGPRPFGLMTVVMIFAGFVESVVGECATETLVSIPHAEPEHFAAMTTLCALAATVFGVGVYAAAQPIARWFGEPQLVDVSRCMAVLPFVSIIAAPANAACKREMQFRPLALRTVVSLVIGGIVGIALTVLKFGVWALVGQIIVQKSVAAVVLWNATPLSFRFGLSRRHVRSFPAFVAPLFVSRCMSWTSVGLPRFILGSFLGVGDLGIMSLASRLSDIAVHLFVVPRYSVARVDLRRYASNRSGLDGAIELLVFRYAVLTFPACIGAAAVMPSLFHAWLDARWYPGILPAQVLMLTGLPCVTIYTIGALLMALNQQGAEAWLETAQTIGAVLFVGIAAPFGLVVSAAAMAMRPFALLPLPLSMARRRCGVSAGQILKPQWPPLLAAVCMGIVVTVLQYALQRHVSALAMLPMLAGTGVAAYAAILGLRYPRVATAIHLWWRSLRA